jgi:hypothetical protein
MPKIKRKLSIGQVVAIRAKYGPYPRKPRPTVQSLAAEYGVNPSTIWRILAGKAFV